ncbi:MAG TPA: PaaI family thioesterase [Burkholderiaceae bacterium]
MNDIESVQKLLQPLFPGLLGMELIELGPERVAARLRVRADLCTVGGILHGGAVMAFADTLGAVATFVNLPQGARTTTIESKTNFFAAAAVDTVVTAECTPFHKGKSTMVWQTHIRNEAGKLSAVVTQTQLILPA